MRLKVPSALSGDPGLVTKTPDQIFFGGRFWTLDWARPYATAVAISGSKFTHVGNDEEILRLAGSTTQRVNLLGRQVLPGLVDNHLHLIRGGLSYNLELRWDGVTSRRTQWKCSSNRSRLPRSPSGSALWEGFQSINLSKTPPYAPGTQCHCA